jgi:hypothetical protein
MDSFNIDKLSNEEKDIILKRILKLCSLKDNRKIVLDDSHVEIMEQILKIFRGQNINLDDFIY